MKVINGFDQTSATSTDIYGPYILYPSCLGQRIVNDPSFYTSRPFPRFYGVTTFLMDGIVFRDGQYFQIFYISLIVPIWVFVFKSLILMVED